jgi:cysteine desulfurase
LAMGYTKTDAVGGIRITLGKSTTAADIDWTAMVLKQILDRLTAILIMENQLVLRGRSSSRP